MGRPLETWAGWSRTNKGPGARVESKQVEMRDEEMIRADANISRAGIWMRVSQEWEEFVKWELFKLLNV